MNPLGKGTFPKALDRLKQARLWSDQPIMYSTTPELDESLTSATRSQEPYVARFGPALGVYTGPGAIGIALIQAAA